MKIIGKASSQDLIHKHGELALFNFILGYVPSIKKKYTSPVFVRNDKTPGCFFKYHNNRLRFYDYGYSNKGLSVFDLAMKKFNCSFNESVRIIERSIENVVKPKIDIISQELPNPYEIKIIRESWNDGNIKFWNNLGVTRNRLVSHKVHSCTEVWSNKGTSTMYKLRIALPAYAYVYDNHRMKIYMPESEKRHFGNTTINDMFGITENSDILIITSSPKDVLVTKSLVPQHSVVSPNSESIHIPEEIMTTYLSMYERIIFMYDNDAVGIQSATMHAEKYGCETMFTPIKKDISDLYLHDPDTARKLCQSIQKTDQDGQITKKS